MCFSGVLENFIISPANTRFAVLSLHCTMLVSDREDPQVYYLAGSLTACSFKVGNFERGLLI